MSARAEGRQRGLPVWQALAVLMLLPLIAAGIMGGVSVVAAQRSTDQALRAQRLVAAVERFDTVRRAVDAEILPSMLLGVLRDEKHSTRVGFPPDRRALLRVTGPALLVHLRTVTDRSLDAAAADPGAPELKAVVIKVRSALHDVRGHADKETYPLQAVANYYATIGSILATSQRWANAQAISAGLSSHSVSALQDLDQVLLVRTCEPRTSRMA